MNPAVAEDPSVEGRPPELSIPSELRYDTLSEHPVDPRLILDLCLNPSVPKPPIPYAGSSQCSPTEIQHVLACGESLRMALDLLNELDQARAPASTWFAQRFILDLVTRFGAVVKSVCIVRDGLALVELTPAPLTRAVAWATFSGSGTYLLNVDNGKVEEKVFPGSFSRAGRMGSGAYVELLERFGWPRKREA